MSGRTRWTSMDGNLWGKKYARCLVFFGPGIETEATLDWHKRSTLWVLFCTIVPCGGESRHGYSQFQHMFQQTIRVNERRGVWHARGNPGGFLVFPWQCHHQWNQRGHCQPTGCFMDYLSNSAMLIPFLVAAFQPIYIWHLQGFDGREWSRAMICVNIQIILESIREKLCMTSK